MLNAAVCFEARQHQGVQRMVEEAGGADAAAEGWLTSNRSALRCAGVNHRKKRYRARQRKGLSGLRVVAHEHALAEALLETGRLTEEQAVSRDYIKCAFSKPAW
jgi:hypothetical protein